MKTNVGVQRRSTSGLPIFDSLANAVSTVDNLLIDKLTGSKRHELVVQITQHKELLL